MLYDIYQVIEVMYWWLIGVCVFDGEGAVIIEVSLRNYTLQKKQLSEKT